MLPGVRRAFFGGIPPHLNICVTSPHIIIIINKIIKNKIVNRGVMPSHAACSYREGGEVKLLLLLKQTCSLILVVAPVIGVAPTGGGISAGCSHHAAL